MRHGSLFSGIGGAELAASWMGWDNVFHCEKDKYCRKLLKQHYPNSIEHEDIKTANFIQYRGRINILTAGFPCQPFSQSGKRKGKEDDRYLWPETIGAVEQIQPDWFVGENVFGIINWSRGMVFNQVQTDLETAGYEVFPYVLPACGLNAPHRGEKGFGLLPTPKATEIEEEYGQWKARMIASGNPKNVGKTIANIGTMARSGMLPTPTRRDHKGARSSEALEAAGRGKSNSLPDFFNQAGKTSQLNPRFVEEMMGYPIDYTALKD